MRTVTEDLKLFWLPFLHQAACLLMTSLPFLLISDCRLRRWIEFPVSLNFWFPFCDGAGILGGVFIFF